MTHAGAGLKPSRAASRPFWRARETTTIAQEFEQAVEDHGAGVMSVLSRVLRDRDEARDAYQETWFAVWRRWPFLYRAHDPWPYIRRTAFRKALDRLRRRHTEPGSLDGRDLAAPPEREQVAIDLAALPEEQRTCLRLFFWEGLSVRQIAERLGVPEGTVKTWMFRGRARLRRRLSRGEEA